MMEYEPTDDVSVDGDASKVESKAESALGYEIIGATALANGTVKHITVSESLTQSELNALQTEFGVSWTEIEVS